MAGLSLSLLLVVAPLAWVALHDDTYVVPPPRSSTPRAQPALATEALDGLRRALADGDPAAARALAPAGDAGSGAALAALASNARHLGVRDLALRYVDEEGAVSADGTWAAAVDATWRFAGFDPSPAESEVTVRFRVQEGRAAVVGVGGGDRRTPVWLSGPVLVRRGAGTMVVVAAPSGSSAADAARRADAYAAHARAAVPVVRRVLTTWRPRLVVEVPATAAGLDRALDADPGKYAAIAAVTTTVDGSTRDEAPVHVFVNPQVFGGLRPAGAQVVLSHEVVHVATDAARSTMPLWLLEGFADYVALRDVHLPLRTTAGQVIREVRRDGPPDALPDAQDFDTAATHLGASYEAAWLACRTLADDGGQRALLGFYRRVDAGADVGPALRADFGIGLRAFTAQWRERLVRAAS